MQYLMIFLALLIWLPFVSFRNPFLLRHIFLVYLFLIYNIAPLVLLNEELEYDYWFLEFIAVLLLFASGYAIGLSLARRRARADASVTTSSSNTSSYLKPALIAMLLINALFLLKTIFSVGVANFYAGELLVANIQNYGKENLSGAVVQVVTFVLGSVTTVLLCMLVERVVNQQCMVVTPSHLKGQKRLALRFSFIWLVLFPLVQFSRSTLVFGVLTFLAVRSKLIKKSVIPQAVLFGSLALVFFVVVGTTRSEAMKVSIPIESLFVSELTPFTAYREIKNNIDVLQYQYGYRLFLPFVLKIIPRGLFPYKIQNSGGYFMEILYPEQFKAGFALAPTYMGSLYINFGLFGVLVGTWLIGVFSGQMDGTIIYKLRNIGLFFLVFSVYPSLLRDDLSSTAFDLSVKIALYFIFKRLFALKLVNIYKSIALILRPE